MHITINSYQRGTYAMNEYDNFKNKVLLITGGTGTFGHTALERFLDMGLAEIRIFSRDEKKQDDMRKKYTDPIIKFYIGDVRDYTSISNACRHVDFIFHAAALKQVPSCEFYPMEAVKTNIIGTENVLEAAVQNGVQRVVCLSTDKAVYPINAMGMSKAIMEKIMVAKSRNVDFNHVVLCGTRYGNIMTSRGSVIPIFLQQLARDLPITITNPEMTRFMMTPENSVDLVVYGFTHGQNGDIFVQKSPASSIFNIAHALMELFDKADHPIKYIGTRHGEKVYESLVSREEMMRATDCGDYYKIPADTRDLNYSKYIDEGQIYKPDDAGYNSHNTQQLNLEDTKKILLKVEIIRKLIEKGTEPKPSSKEKI